MENHWCTGAADQEEADAEMTEALLASDCGIKDISDISIVKDMPELWAVKMSDNDVADLKPLAGLKDLHSVSFTGNRISDLTPLAACHNLAYLGGAPVCCRTY